jgi:hypothetical protein
MYWRQTESNLFRFLFLLKYFLDVSLKAGESDNQLLRFSFGGSKPMTKIKYSGLVVRKGQYHSVLFLFWQGRVETTIYCLEEHIQDYLEEYL